MPSSTTTPRGVFLWANPRTASNLFMRLISSQPDVAAIQNPFYQVYLSHPEIFRNATFAEKLQETGELNHVSSATTFPDALDRVYRFMAAAELDLQLPVIKEHPDVVLHPSSVVEHHTHLGLEGDSKPSLVDFPELSSFNSTAKRTNPTYLPDNFLLSLFPVFLIRHPLIAIPSNYRATKAVRGDFGPETPQFRIAASMRWSRVLFDWYREMITDRQAFHPMWPIVIDAEDMIHGDAFEKLCAALCLDPAAIPQQWSSGPGMGANWTTLNAAYWTTLSQSKGVMKGHRPQSPKIEDEYPKWVEEFGEAAASGLKDLVLRVMPDYEYLREARFKYESYALP